MSRFIRIVIFTCLIAAIVFFGFRASPPLKGILTDNVLPHDVHTNEVSTSKTNTSSTSLSRPSAPENAVDEQSQQPDDTIQSNSQEKITVSDEGKGDKENGDKDPMQKSE